MNGFPIYYPWSIWQLLLATKSAREALCMLDVQLGSACNAKCPRCDSSCCDLNEPSALDIEAVGTLADEISKRTEIFKSKDIALSQSRPQGFVCGLGEPTAGSNLEKLKDLIRRTKDNGFIWSMFSNGLYWDTELDEFLKGGSLAVMVQCNSNKADLVAGTMGISQRQAEKHLENREYLWKTAVENVFTGCTEPGCTNIAASIVPDQDNYLELPQIIDDSVGYNVFPLVGELEEAGNSVGKYYDEHRLDQEMLRDILGYINITHNIKYEVPLCPAAIGAIHVNNRNLVTVDAFTGLSCSWFGMGNPEVKVIGDIREMTYDEIVTEILTYREIRISHVQAAIKDYPEMVFGGCGGNARKLLSEYVALYN